MEQPNDDVFEQIKKQLDDGVYEQLKDFKRYFYDKLTKEQELLVDKLILDEDLKNNYKTYGLCNKCKQPKNNKYWCRLCTFQQNFKNWTSGNHDVDKFIQKMQLKAKWINEVIEWIEYDRFKNVEYLAKGGFGTTYKAIWKEGHIWCWDYENNQWKRTGETKVALKCLHNSQDITAEFLREVR